MAEQQKAEIKEPWNRIPSKQSRTRTGLPSWKTQLPLSIKHNANGTEYLH